MKLIVGLGNPGTKFEGTRHNAGFVFIDKLQSKIINFQSPISKQPSISNFQENKKFNSEILRIEDMILAKPTTFMNNSGLAVSNIAKYYKLHSTDIYVVCDDLDIALGEYKIQKRRGPKVHNGLNSIYEKIGTKDFWHIRIGINSQDSRMVSKRNFIFKKKTSKIPGEDYVLMPFTPSEMKVLDVAIETAIEELRELLVD